VTAQYLFHDLFNLDAKKVRVLFAPLLRPLQSLDKRNTQVPLRPGNVWCENRHATVIPAPSRDPLETPPEYIKKFFIKKPFYVLTV
jgi:hypothetical protein